MTAKSTPCAILAEFDGWRWLIRSDIDESKAFHGRTFTEALGKLVLHHKTQFGLDIKAFGRGRVPTHPTALPATPGEVAFMEENMKDGRQRNARLRPDEQ